eukprot:g17181.t1
MSHDFAFLRHGARVTGGALHGPVVVLPPEAWTDRILFRSKTSPGIMVAQYNMHHNLKQSDHRVIFASLRCSCDEQIAGRRRQRPTAFGEATTLAVEPKEISFKDSEGCVKEGDGCGAKPDVAMQHTVQLSMACASGLLRQRYEVFFETPGGFAWPLAGAAMGNAWAMFDVDEKGEETDFERYFKYKDDDDNQWVKTTLLRLASPPDRVVSGQLNKLVTGFTEFRQDWSHLPRGWLTYHSFNFIHISGGELTICLEKKTDKLDRLGGIGSRESNGFVWKIWVGQNG